MPGYQHLKNLSDKELLLRIEKHSEIEAIGILLERYSHLIVMVCLKYIDEAGVAAATKKILQQLNIDLQNYHIDNLNNWVYRLVRQYCLAQRTSPNSPSLSQSKRESTEESRIPAVNVSAWSSAEKEKIIGRLQTVFNTLPKEEQDCINEFYIRGKTFEEIALQKNLPAEIIKKNIREGKRKIQAAVL